MAIIFDEAGIRVDADFVHVGGKSLRVNEIKVVETGINSEDSDTAKVAWFFAALLFLVGLLSPWLFLPAFGVAGLAAYKQQKPVVHTLRVSTGGLFNSHAYQSTDGDHIQRLRAAIETAVSAQPSVGSLPNEGPPPGEAPRAGVQVPAGPWG